MSNVRRLRAVERKTTDERLREAFPELDFDKVVEKGAFNAHNLGEKWDALVRQLDWWLTIN